MFLFPLSAALPLPLFPHHAEPENGARKKSEKRKGKRAWKGDGHETGAGTERGGTLQVFGEGLEMQAKGRQK